MAQPVTKDDVIRISEEEGLPPEFALNIWQQESSSGKNANTSVDGAVGGFQVMPETFKTVMPDGKIDDPFDNARAGIRVLKRSHDKYGGDPTSVFSAYHSGSAGFYTRRGNLKQDGLGKTTLSYTSDALRRHEKLTADLGKTPKTATKKSATTTLTAEKPTSKQKDLPQPTLALASPGKKPKKGSTNTSLVPQYAMEVEPNLPTAYHPETSPYGDGALSALDKRLLKLIDEV